MLLMLHWQVSLISFSLFSLSFPISYRMICYKFPSVSLIPSRGIIFRLTEYRAFTLSFCPKNVNRFTHILSFCCKKTDTDEDIFSSFVSVFRFYEICSEICSAYTFKRSINVLLIDFSDFTVVVASAAITFPR